MGLLKGLDPILSADLLYILRAMGHGDKLVICDCNFPAVTTAKDTTTGQVVHLTVDLERALDAVLSVLPLDFYSAVPVIMMAPGGKIPLPMEGAQVRNAAQDSLSSAGFIGQFTLEDRFAFYDAAKTAFAVVQTAERRPYGNIILTKGSLGSDGRNQRPEARY